MSDTTDQTHLPRSCQRFTLDGTKALEDHLTLVCGRVLEGVRAIVRRRRLAGVVLGGGYGRGEGGVLYSTEGDRPYNDLEFYVFTRGSRVLNDRVYRRRLNALGEQLSPGAGLHIEFKVDSLVRLQTTPVSMFSYDLVSAHKIIFGEESLFAGCGHHLDPSRIPLSEATRLLFNRCTGLLLARQLLLSKSMTAEDSDFIARNVAKAQLAMGDALLVAIGRYHWSCLERAERLRNFPQPQLKRLGLGEGAWHEIQLQHDEGVKFKLHPYRSLVPPPVLKAKHTSISALARDTWLAIEKLRLGQPFPTHLDYALAPINKCSDTHPVRNLLLNLNTFGADTLLDPRRFRYPRERLLNSLPLLLWEPETQGHPAILHHLQRTLHSKSGDWSQLVAAYKQIWPQYG